MVDGPSVADSSVQVKAAAFMTAPRYEAVWARNIIERSLKAAGVPLNVSGGVFYGQCMQKMLVDAVAAGIDYAVTVDFDSLFTHGDVSRLLGIMATRPDIDALAALQSRRGGLTPLFTIAGVDGPVESDGSPMRVSTAHFGLTVIRLSSLAKVPKPWFWCTPTESGDWVANVSIDDDVFFWKRWAAAGLSVFVDPSTSIGHYEEVVACFDADGNHRFVYPKDWHIEAFGC